MTRREHTSGGAGLLSQLREEIRRRLFPHRHTALLAALIVMFLVRPFTGDSGAGPPLTTVAMLLLLMLALYNIDVDELVGDRKILLAQRRRRNIIAWTLGVPAVLERLVALLAPTHKLYFGGTFLWLLLFAYITWNELRAVLKQKEVTREVISMSISTYLLLGFTCGHFSLTTLSTIGFGDITPVTLQARYVAVAEGIAGQFYLAILVARLVGMQMTQSSTQHAEQEAIESDTKAE
jgi:hypothetical protein